VLGGGLGTGEEELRQARVMRQFEAVRTMSFVNDPYFRPLLRALLLQFLLLAFCTRILDGGVIFDACAKSSAAFWAGVIVILVRRPKNPTRGDLIYVRWGLLPIVTVGVYGFLTVWHAKGYVL
jgi:hypothetical protein